jgi:hypothetical protein
MKHLDIVGDTGEPFHFCGAMAGRVTIAVTKTA